MFGAGTAYNTLFASARALSTPTQQDPVHIAILRNVTIEGLELFLRLKLHSMGISSEVTIGGYGNIVQDILADKGSVKSADADVIVLSLVLPALDSSCRFPGWTCSSARAELEQLFTLLEQKTKATIVLNTMVGPPDLAQSFALAADGGDFCSQLEELNRFIREWVRRHGPRFCLVDWNRYIALHGGSNALDLRGDYLWKAPFKRAFLETYATDIARVIRVLKGRAKKCLIADCDNTLWGGVLGEEGVDGIDLDPATYPGVAYHDFQATLLHLAARGVLIALCSRNEEADVFEVMERHPACRLKRAHLAAWRINWRDKAANIQAIANELNLGLDSLVFIDDNPAECELVRALLPEVTVLQVPEQLYELPSLPIRDGLFDTLSLTAEDAARSELYQRDRERKGSRSQFTSVAEYLASLKTAMAVRRMSLGQASRVAQLTQKTNQFNLTTRRYSKGEIEAFDQSPDHAVYVASASDRFGELGLIGVVILKHQSGVGYIDTCLMSCRALGRELEKAMINTCLSEMASRWNVACWEAEYVPTRKNVIAADFWREIGFLPSAGESGRRKFRYEGEWTRRLPAHISLSEQ